jgi:hypothetical protein
MDSESLAKLEVKEIEDLEVQQMNDKEKMYDLIMTVLDNPEKAKEILSKRD